MRLHNGMQLGKNSFTDATTLVELIEQRAISFPDRTIHSFLEDGITITKSITYQDLSTKAKQIANDLLRYCNLGDHVLLLYPSCLEFVEAFFGCLYAGLIAVPAYPPKPNKSIRRIQAIVKDADVKLILTTAGSRSRIVNGLESIPECQHISCIASDATDDNNLTEHQWTYPGIDADSAAFLQYTSGSTGDPRGVVINHKNLLYNSEIMRHAFGLSDQSIGATWLPSFHDMGLIEGILQPLYTNFPNYMIPPVVFVQDPFTWLKTISDFGVTHSGAPNFGFDHCVNMITEEQINQLELSCWINAYCGSEPVRHETMERFAEKFKPAGFKYESLYPCYGMAESTLMISGGSVSAPPVFRSVDSDALEKNRIVESNPDTEHVRYIANCGKIWLDTKAIIVDPNTNIECDTDQVGELWISGTTVSPGYYKREQHNQESFHAYLSDTNEGPFFRTGDLGFIQDGDIYITGRLKDVIIIRGRNLYPQDIEHTVIESHSDLRHAAGSGAAFTIQMDEQERLVVVQEVKRTAIRKLNIEEVARSVAKAIAHEHEVQLYALVLIKPASIFKTSSGKIERNSCRQAYLNQEFNAVATWCAESTSTMHHTSPVNDVQKEAQDTDDYLTRSNELTTERLEWIREYASTRINSRMYDERRCFPPHVILDFGNQGLLGMQVPAQYGGLDIGYQDTLRVIEQLGSIDLSLGLLVGLNNILGIRPIQQFASDAVKEQWLPILAQGRELGAFSLTEPDAGSNPRSIVSYAQSDPQGGWRLYGKKIWSGSASWAGVINVFVKHHSEDQTVSGMSGFVVQQGSKGLHQGPEALTMGMRGMVQNEFTLDAVHVDEHSLLGSPGDGFVVATDAMSYGRIAIGALALGGMKRCLQLMRRYATRRTISTGKLFDNPYTRLCLSNHIFATHSLEALLQKIGSMMDQGQPIPPEINAVCKINGPELLWSAVDNLAQMLGGRGYIETSLVPQMLRDARILRVFEGPTETLNMYIGQNVMNQDHKLIQFISDEMNAAIPAARLQVVIQEISQHWLNTSGVFDTPTQRRQQACLLIGEVVSAAVLWAAVVGQNGTGEVVEWTRRRFEKIAARAVSCDAEEFGLLSHDSILDFVDRIDHSLGDIDQNLPGENYQQDPILRKDHIVANTFTPELIPSELEQPASENTIDEQNQSEIIEWVTRWLERNLKIANAQVDLNTSFSEMGIDSLLSITFSFDFGEYIGMKLDENTVWDYPTIKHLLQLVSTKNTESHQKPKETFNLNDECLLDEHTVPTILPQWKSKPFKEVFLTGATGFLGAYLLRELLEYDDVTVHCLVRAKTEEEGAARLIHTLDSYGLWIDSYRSRICPVPGDLSKDLFDLSPQQFDQIAMKVDAVYHNAAQVNFVANYQSLKSVNVESTRDILRMATTGSLKPVHLISTVAVFESYQYAGVTVDETNAADHCDGMEMGYSQSKWVAEQLVRNARVQGVPVCIYRPPLISGDSRTGIWNTDDFTCRYIKGCIQMQQFPDLDYLLDISPVDYVSRSVVYLSMQERSLGNNFHLSNPKPWHWRNLAEWLNHNGYPVSVVPYDQWVDALRDHQTNADCPLYALRPFYAQKRGEQALAIPQIYEQERRPIILTDITQRALQGSQISCMPVNNELMSRYFGYFVKSGFIHPALIMA